MTIAPLTSLSRCWTSTSRRASNTMPATTRQQPHQLAGLSGWDRVPTAVVADQAIPADLARERQGPHEALFGKWREVRQLLLETIDGPLERRAVHTHVQIVALEDRQLLQEVRERREVGAFDELLLQVEKWSFDFSLRLGAVRLTRARPDSIVTAQLEKLRVPAEVGWVRIQHERLGVVDQQLFGRRAKMAQATLDRLEDRGLRLIQAGGVVLAP